MVKDYLMLISEFARATGLSVDTVRFHIRKGLLKPDIGEKGGSNRYQIFDATHVETARTIRLAQSLGFTLKEIAALNDEYRAGEMVGGRHVDVLRAQTRKLEDKAAQLAAMIGYMRAKIARLEAGAPRSAIAACAMAADAG